MPYLSREKIEGIAARVVDAYWRLNSQAGAEKRICPEILAQKLLGLKVEYRTLSRNGVRVYEDNSPGYYFLDGHTILLESSLAGEKANPGRRNFTLMHETCHQIFRILFPAEYMPPAQCRKVCCCTSSMYGYRIKPINWEEWRVNTLAASILMPKDLLIEQMHTAGLGNNLRLLNKIFAPKEYEKFAAVAEAMGVSKAALAIRMKQLHLLDRDDLKDPYALVRVVCDEE